MSEEKLKAFAPIFGMIKQTMGFVPNSTKTMAMNPPLLEAFSKLGLQIMTAGKVDPELKFLVSHISSKASGCMYCQAHTIGLAERNGASTEKLNAVWDFESSVLFDEKEKAALRFGLAAGSTPNAVTDQHFKTLRTHFSELEILEFGAIVSFYGFLNRWNETFSTPLESEAIEKGKKYLAKSGWEIGRHQ